MKICSYTAVLIFMTVKTRVTTQKFLFIDDNSQLEDNSEKSLGPALGNVLGLKLLVVYIPLHVEKSGEKNCYIVSGFACTSRFADLAESRWQSRDARQHASQQVSRYMAVSVKSFRRKNMAH